MNEREEIKMRKKRKGNRTKIIDIKEEEKEKKCEEEKIEKSRGRKRIKRKR